MNIARVLFLLVVTIAPAHSVAQPSSIDMRATAVPPPIGSAWAERTVTTNKTRAEWAEESRFYRVVPSASNGDSLASLTRQTKDYYGNARQAEPIAYFLKYAAWPPDQSRDFSKASFPGAYTFFTPPPSFVPACRADSSAWQVSGDVPQSGRLLANVAYTFTLSYKINCATTGSDARLVDVVERQSVLISEETITVPAGTYPAFRVTEKVTIEAPVDKVIGPIPRAFERDQWLIASGGTPVKVVTRRTWLERGHEEVLESVTERVPLETFKPMEPSEHTRPRIGYTDFWWNPGESGWGLHLTHAFRGVLGDIPGSAMFGVWYLYGQDGKPLWVTLNNGQWTSPDTFSGELYVTSGPSVLEAGGEVRPFDANQVTQRKGGSFRLSFTSGSSARFAYALDGVSGEKSIERFEFGSPIAEPVSSQRVSHTGAEFDPTGLWWGGVPGWGVTISKQGNTLFAAFFVYEDGKPLWLLMSASYGANASQVPGYRGKLYTADGPSLAIPFDAIAVATREVGEASLSFGPAVFSGFVVDNEIDFSYTFNGKRGSRRIVPFVLY